MTATYAQPKRLLTSIAKTVSGVRADVSQVGRKVEGEINLDAPNPRKRIRCKVSYSVPASWTDAENEAALTIAAQWFRDIGGLQTICKKHLCHIVARIKEGISPREMHFAVKEYARCPWNVNKCIWVSIQSFFIEKVEEWIDRSAELQREREIKINAERKPQRQATERRLTEQSRQEDRRQRELAKKRAADRAAKAEDQRRKQEEAKKAKADQPKTIWEANERLPESHRWVIPALASRRTKAEVRTRAQAMLAETHEMLWAILPDPLRAQVNGRVQMDHYHKHGQFPPSDGRTTDAHLRALIAIAQDQATRIKPVGNAHTMSKITKEATA